MQHIISTSYIQAGMSRTGAGEPSSLREEVLNVKLAELLSRSGILSIPESILSETGQRRMPDITVGDYWGVRVVLEGRTADQRAVFEQLERDCVRRVEEGIAAIAIGVAYPPELRHSEWSKLEQTLQEVTFRIKVFSEAGEEGWVDSDFEGLSAILRRAYESLVNEDVVSTSVEELRQSIEVASRELSGSPGTAGRLRNLLIIPSEQEVDQDDQ